MNKYVDFMEGHVFQSNMKQQTVFAQWMAEGGQQQPDAVNK